MQQIDLFLWRKGIELYPQADRDDIRLRFIERVWKHNRTSLYLTDIWEKGAISGSVLLYVRPNGKSYKVSYYPANEFVPYYNGDGDLETVVINTSHQGEDRKTNYSRLRIKPGVIEKWSSEREIVNNSVPDSVTTNPYGLMPCVVIDNRPTGPGKRGRGEFSQFKGQIEDHDWKLSQVNGNLEFFGGPIFYSSRSQQEMTEAGMVEQRSVAEAGGYGGSQHTERIKARRIFDNLEPGEQIGFATPEPITPENLNFINQTARQIRAALGSVDEGEASATSTGTSFELKTILGRAIQTASRRAESYLTFGIAEAYSLILQMAEHDQVLPVISPETTINWRHLGDVFQETPQDTLTKSIVGRNLLRLGVNVEECIRYLFPGKRDNEIEALLENGFAYEFLNGVANVSKTLLGAKDPQTGDYAIAIEEFIQETLDARPISKPEPKPASESISSSRSPNSLPSGNELGSVERLPHGGTIPNRLNTNPH